MFICFNHIASPTFIVNVVGEMRNSLSSYRRLSEQSLGEGLNPSREEFVLPDSMQKLGFEVKGDEFHDKGWVYVLVGIGTCMLFWLCTYPTLWVSTEAGFVIGSSLVCTCIVF